MKPEISLNASIFALTPNTFFGKFLLLNDVLNLYSWLGLSLACFVLLIFLTIYKTQSARIEKRKLERASVSKPRQGKESASIDIRNATVTSNTMMRDHDNGERNSLRRICTIFYDNNDRTGSIILGMPHKNTPSLITVLVDGIPTRGYMTRNSVPGTYPGSKLLRINRAWWMPRAAGNNMTTVGAPLNYPFPNCEVRTSHPFVSSFRN